MKTEQFKQLMLDLNDSGEPGVTLIMVSGVAFAGIVRNASYSRPLPEDLLWFTLHMPGEADKDIIIGIDGVLAVDPSIAPHYRQRGDDA